MPQLFGRKKKTRKLATTGQIAVRVRELRRNQGLTIHQLHDKVKGAEVKPGRTVSVSYLMKLEKGRLNDVKTRSYQAPDGRGGVETRHAGMGVVVGRIAYVLGVKPDSILSA